MQQPIELYYRGSPEGEHGDVLITEEERQLRINLAAMYRLSALHGWDELIYTHITVKLPGPDKHFLINPLGYRFPEIKASDFVRIDMEGCPVYPTKHTLLKAGFSIHAAIHMAREDIKCVFHVHTRAGMAVSALREGLLPLTQHAMMFYGRTAYFDNDGFDWTPEGRAKLAAAVGNNTIIILRNHGLITMGNSCADAFNRMYFLDQACKAQVDALSCGRDLTYPPLEFAQRISDGANQKDENGVGHADLFEWPALLRWLDKIDPSYRY